MTQLKIDYPILYFYYKMINILNQNFYYYHIINLLKTKYYYIYIFFCYINIFIFLLISYIKFNKDLSFSLNY